MLKIDLHLHTIASLHAFNTLCEYIEQAKKNKMKVIGISDHGPATESSLTDNIYFRTLDRIPKKVSGIRILRGAEANIIGPDGEIDLSEKALAKLDYVIANFHLRSGYEDKGKKKNTQAMIKAIESGKINIISHPHVIDTPIDHKKIYETACKNSALLEINLSYLAARRINKETLFGIKEIVDTAKRFKCKVIVNSDSHCIWELGDDSNLKKYKKELGLTDSMIINNYPKELFKLLKIDE